MLIIKAVIITIVFETNSKPQASILLEVDLSVCPESYYYYSILLAGGSSCSNLDLGSYTPGIRMTGRCTLRYYR